MKRTRIWIGLGAVAFVTAAFAFSPFTYSPEAVQIDTAKGEQCTKEPGRLKCRWDGPCVQVGNQCMSCQKDQQWSGAMGKCYTCPKGTSLKQVNGAWECS